MEETLDERFFLACDTILDYCLALKADETNGDGEVIFNIGQGGCSNAVLTVSYDQMNYLPYQDNSFSTD